MMNDNIPMTKKQTKIVDYVRSGSCLGSNPNNALNSLKDGDLRIFTDVLNSETTNQWIDTELDSEDGKTLLILALERRLPDFVSVLIKAGTNVNRFNESLGLYPIHVAVRSEDIESLNLLLSVEGVKVDSIIKTSGRSSLHLAVEMGSIRMVESLLNKKSIRINLRDKKGGQTPLFLAASSSKTSSSKIVKLLLNHGADPTIQCLGGQTALDLLKRRNDLDDLDLDRIARKASDRPRISSVERLGEIVELLALGKGSFYQLMNEFQFGLLQFQEDDIRNFRFPGNISLIQKICEENVPECIKTIVNEFPDILNGGNDELNPPPVVIAAYRGSRKLLEIFAEQKVDFTVMKSDSRETVLHLVLKKDEFQEAAEFLLNSGIPDLDLQMRKIVNKRDFLENTPLHYATQKWDQETVMKLLKLGANVGMKNKWNEIPITNILPSTLERFLTDHCLESHGGDVNHDDFKLEFNYSFLAPPYEDVSGDYTVLTKERRNDDQIECQSLAGRVIEQDVYALPETQSLWSMCQSKDHRYLLKHPVITSFLWCKWGRIRRYFNRNLRFFLIFVFITTWFIFENFGGKNLKNSQNYIPFWYVSFLIFSLGMIAFILRDWESDIKNMMQNSVTESRTKIVIKVLLSSWLEALLVTLLLIIILLGEKCLRPALISLTICLIIREFLQLTVSLRRYILSPENWIEVSLIVFIGVLLFDKTNDDGLKRHLSAITIVLSWAEMITLIGKHPKLSRYNVYVTMFYKVMGTFFFFLAWYALFIVAFGMAFYILFHNEHRSDDKDAYIFFDTPWLSLVKTSTMFVGELEFSDIPIDFPGPYAALSYAFFLSFVFLIVVVLMNLLNGLAVSDTGIIQEKAEIVGYVSRVETISYTESVLLGDPFNFLSNWPALKWIRNIPSFSFCNQLYKHKAIQSLFHKVTGATGILLFYSFLPDKKLILKPNERRGDCSCMKIEDMDESIISSAKRLILEKESRSKTLDDKEFSSKIESILEFLRKSESRQTELLNRLDFVESKLRSFSH